MKKSLWSVLLFAATGSALAQGASPSGVPGPVAVLQGAAVAATGVQGVRVSALAFVADPAQVARQGLAPSSLHGGSLDVSRVPLLQQPGFGEHIARSGVIGAPLDERTLARLRASLLDWLRRSGHGAIVIIPPQDATNGVVQVLVMQPRLGALRVEGARVFPEGIYRDAVRLRPGEPLDTGVLDEDIAWIQRANPFRSAVAVASPGQRPGETDITLQVSEQRPWKVGLWADNSGTRTTQRERLGASVTAGNVLGLGHLASYNLATSPDLRSYVGHTVVYSLPLAWRDKLNVIGSYATVRARMPEPFDSSGHSSEVMVRYDRFLRSLSGWSQGASLALDYKDADNNLLFSSTPVFGNRTAILQLVAGYDGSGADAWGRTQLRASVAASPGDTVSRNDDAAFAATRPGAKARYVYANAAVVRTTDLPAGWLWTADARLQWSGTNLLGSEQLPAMGIAGVRGFPEAGLYADRGLVWRNELGPRALRMGEQASAQLFAILDTATVGSAEPQPGEQRHYRFSSLGLGARLVGTGWQAQLEVAKPVAANWNDAPQGWRAHARVSWEY